MGDKKVTKVKSRGDHEREAGIKISFGEADSTVLVRRKDMSLPYVSAEVSTALLQKERRDEPGKTYDAGKLRFDLIPPEWETALAEVMSAGAAKYADRNWEKGLSWSRRYGSMRRHMNAFWAGEDRDKETGLPHLAHAAWNALALLTFMTTHPEFDDRVKGRKS